MNNFLKNLKLDDKGLITAVIQDAANNEVLMVGYMNAEALKRTVETGKVTFWSRSRQQYWVKGESSGHTQNVKEIFFDCDIDCLLIKVEQKGGACHEGYRTCFFRRLNNDGSAEVVLKKVFDPNKVY
jgi:phosphoribosyl-AMP cyclohydrolase